MVEGVVTLDGTPVSEADVIFYPLDPVTGEGATGRTDDKGYYQLSSVRGVPGKGTTAGEYRITVSQWVTRELDEPYLDRDALVRFESKELLPVIYTEVSNTPLSATVVPGKNEINLILDSKR